MTESKPGNSCLKCGGALYQTGKDTFSGEVWREYTCRSCGHVQEVNEGIAFWKVIHDSTEQDKHNQ